MQVQIQVVNADDVIARLDKLGQALYTFDAAMADIGQAAVQYFSVLPFNSQGGVFGDVWAPLSDAYAAWKAKKLGTPILVGKNDPHMQDQFTYDSSSTSVTIYNTADYFPYLQLGTSRMPARNMIGFNDEVRGFINDIINKDIADKLASV